MKQDLEKLVVDFLGGVGDDGIELAGYQKKHIAQIRYNLKNNKIEQSDVVGEVLGQLARDGVELTRRDVLKLTGLIDGNF